MNTATVRVRLVAVADLPRRWVNGRLVVAGATVADPAVPAEVPVAAPPVPVPEPLPVPAGEAAALDEDPGAVGAAGVLVAALPAAGELEVPVAAEVVPAGAGVAEVEPPGAGVVDVAPVDDVEVVEDGAWPRAWAT